MMDDNEDTNYSFVLKCMAGVAAALLAALVITAIVLMATGSTAAMGLTASAVAAPMIPILVMAVLGFLALLFVGGCHSTGNPGFYSSRPCTNSVMSSTNYPGRMFGGSTHTHSHQDSDFSDYSTNHVHHHPIRGFEHSNTHSHPSVESSGGFSNVHSHR